MADLTTDCIEVKWHAIHNLNIHAALETPMWYGQAHVFERFVNMTAEARADASSRWQAPIVIMMIHAKQHYFVSQCDLRRFGNVRLCVYFTSWAAAGQTAWCHCAAAKSRTLIYYRTLIMVHHMYSKLRYSSVQLEKLCVAS